MDANNAVKPKRDFKKGISAEDNRRRREETSLKLRKEKKEEGLAKRRNLTIAFQDPADLSAAAMPPVPPSAEDVRSDVLQFFQSLMSSDMEEKVKGMRGFRRLLSIEKNPPVQQCVDIGALPIFVQCLQQQQSTELQFEAAWALTNISSTDYTKAVAECQAIPPLVQLLGSGNADIREQSAWCLGNIAGDGAALRDAVLVHNALPMMLANIVQPASLSLLRNCTWSLSNFCRGKPQPALHVIAPALPVLGEIIKTQEDVDTIADAMWALSYVSDGDDQRIQAVVDLGVVPHLVKMMSSNKMSLVVPALRTLGNIVSGSEKQTQSVVDAGVLSVLPQLLINGKKSVRKEACWLLSNIAAGTVQQMQQLFTVPDLLVLVLQQLSNSAEWEVRKEAAWVVSNIATSGKPVHIVQLVEQGAIKPICELLDVGDVKIVLLALEALESVLRVAENGPADTLSQYTQLIDEAGGVDHLEQLQEHENHSVYEKAVSIIERYFGTEEEEESENIVPSSAGNTFSFGTQQSSQKTVDFGNAFAPQQNAHFRF
eukprot:gene4314-4735_t